MNFFDSLVTLSIGMLIYAFWIVINRWYTDRQNDKIKIQKLKENARKEILEKWYYEIDGFNKAIAECDSEIFEYRQNKYSRNYKLRYFYLEKELNFLMIGFTGKLIQ